MISIAFVDDAEWVRPFVESYISRLTCYKVLDASSFAAGEPDVVFFSDGKTGIHRCFKKIKTVFITCENIHPDFSAVHFIILCRHFEHERYLLMPYWAFINEPQPLIKHAGYAAGILSKSREFCASDQSNQNPFRTKRRLVSFRKLSRMQCIYHGSYALANLRYHAQNIHGFLSGFKLFICFESGQSKGYTTEKIVNAMRNGCVPMYWDDPLVHLELNPSRFINVAEFATETEALDHVGQVAVDDCLRGRYLAEPCFMKANRLHCFQNSTSRFFSWNN